MDGQVVFNYILGGAGTVITIFIVNILDRIKVLEKDNKEIADKYIRRDDFKDQLKEIKSMLEKIFDRLETKADKE